MPDVAIRPAASIDESGTMRMPEIRTGKIVPTYLVTLEAGKKEAYFIATKFDETNNFGRFVGFYCAETMDKIVSGYDEIIKNTDKANYVEIQFPWSRIVSVRSLIYRHK
jgi:hypothetical protein